MTLNTINCDAPWCDLVKMVWDATSADERGIVLEFLVRYLDYIVRPRERVPDGNPMNQDADGERVYRFGLALNAVRYCLRDLWCQESVWAWLAGEVPVMASDMQSAVIVSIFCPILTGPIRWDDEGEMFSVDKVMECYVNRDSQWVVLEGFTECSLQKAKATIARYNEWREKQGVPPLDVDVAALEQFLGSPSTSPGMGRTKEQEAASSGSPILHPWNGKQEN